MAKECYRVRLSAFTFGLLLVVISPIVSFVPHGSHFKPMVQPPLRIPMRYNDYAFAASAESETAAGSEAKRTKAVGKPHTDESKAKISAANKGNVPWNKGRQHSEETRRKIAATLSRKAAEAKAKKHAAMLAELGLTDEEWRAQEKAKKKIPRNTSLNEDVRQKISKALKAKWEQPEYRAHMIEIQKSKPARVHSEATRLKISQTLKNKWATNETYRASITDRAMSQSDETRAKISSSLRARWEDAAFRDHMTAISSHPRSAEHRKRISDAVKKKWEDEDYRAKATAGIRRANVNRTSTRVRKPRKSNPKTGTGVSVRRSRTQKVTVRARRDEIEEPRVWKKPSTVSTSSKRRNAVVTGSGSSSDRPKKKKASAKPVTAKKPKSDSSNLNDADRIARLKVTDPHLWAALYDDDDDWGPILPVKTPVEKSRSAL